MEWVLIEKKWQEMAVRLQTACPARQQDQPSQPEAGVRTSPTRAPVAISGNGAVATAAIAGASAVSDPREMA